MTIPVHDRLCSLDVTDGRIEGCRRSPTARSVEAVTERATNTVRGYSDGRHPRSDALAATPDRTFPPRVAPDTPFGDRR